MEKNDTARLISLIELMLSLDSKDANKEEIVIVKKKKDAGCSGINPDYCSIGSCACSRPGKNYPNCRAEHLRLLANRLQLGV